MKAPKMKVIDKFPFLLLRYACFALVLKKTLKYLALAFIVMGVM